MSAYLQNFYVMIIQNWNILLPFIFFSAYIYWVSPQSGRHWINNYLIPVAFFLIMVLRVMISTLFNLQKKLDLNSTLGLINSSFVIIFMGLVIFSYIIRSSPQKQAKGFWEQFYPIFVVIFHLVGSFLISTHTTCNYVPVIYMAGLVLCVIGVALNIAALWQLKRSFSIMVEVRKLVNTGVYRLIRHPLYTGELTHLLGVCLLFNNKVSYTFCIVVIIMQLSRAKLEERKLSHYLPEYQEYKQETGFIVPKFKTLTALIYNKK